MRNLILILLLFPTVNSLALPQDSLVNRIFNLAYNMNYKQAEKLLAESKDNIDKFHFSVLDIDISYWKNVTGTDNPHYEDFEKTLRKYKIEQADDFNQKGIQLIQLSYQLRYEIKRLKLFSSFTTHKKTKLLLEELKNDPRMKSITNPDLFQLYNSMFLYFTNYIKPFGGNSKDENCKLAIATMKRLSASEKIMTKTLASYFLGGTYMKYENTPQLAIPHFNNLRKMYPLNTKFQELLKECKEKAN